jgi:antitoxin PrlF
MQMHYIRRSSGEIEMIKSVITAKSQTTLPTGVRQALGVGPGDRLAYIVEGDRAVIMKAGPDAEDPAIEAFLNFLAHDMISRPRELANLSPTLIDRAQSLTRGMEVDLEAPIHGDVAI